MVYKMRHVSIAISVHSEGSIFVVKIEIEQVSLLFRVVHLSSSFRFVAGNDLSYILDNKHVFGDELARLQPPTASVRCPKDADLTGQRSKNYKLEKETFGQ